MSMRCRTEGREVAWVPMGWGWGRGETVLKGCRKGIPTRLWELRGSESPPGPGTVSLAAVPPSALHLPALLHW